MCKYEHLIAKPGEVFCNIYKDLGQDFPGEKITKEIHSSSFRKGKDIDLSPAIEELAKELLEELDAVYSTKWPDAYAALIQDSTKV